MTQLDLALQPMHAIRFYARLDGKLARWDGHAANPNGGIRELAAELHAGTGRRHTVLAVLDGGRSAVPIDNTKTL